MELFRQLPEGERAELLKMLEEAQGGEGDLPYTAPQRLPFKAEGLPRLVHGRVQQVPQQLPDLEQHRGSQARWTGREGLYTVESCRFRLVLGNLRCHTQQVASANPSEKSDKN